MSSLFRVGADTLAVPAGDVAFSRGLDAAAPMRVGIDLTSIGTLPDEGRDQVIRNLLRGFRELDHGPELVLFAYDFLEESLSDLVPESERRLFRHARVERTLLRDLRLRTLVLGRHVAERNVDVLLFPKIHTGLGRFRVPTVVVPHAIPFGAFPERFSRSLLFRERLLCGADFRLRDRVVAVSDFDAREIRRQYPHAAGKVVRIYNPVLFSDGRPAETSPHPRSYIATVNTRHPHKNAMTLLRAFERVKGAIPHDLVLVGSIDDSNRHLVEFVEQRRLDDRVFFTGYVDEGCLHAIVRHADLYVSPSLYEGFGMATVEAMGAGTPVLSTVEAALPETTRGLAAYYEPARSDAALAEAIREAVANPPGAAERERARTEVREAYDHRRIAAEYWRLFEELAAPRRAAQRAPTQWVLGVSPAEAYTEPAGADGPLAEAEVARAEVAAAEANAREGVAEVAATDVAISEVVIAEVGAGEALAADVAAADVVIAEVAAAQRNAAPLAARVAAPPPD